jgi:hypothetical protein
VELLKYVALTAILVPLLLVPGWAWLRRTGMPSPLALACGPLITVLAMAGTVGLGLVLPWSQTVTVSVSLALMLVAVVACLVTADRPLLPDRRDLAGVGLWVLLFVMIASYLAVPSRPDFNAEPFTLPAGRVETPRLPGAPSDSYLPYRTGQLAIHKLGGSDLRDDFHVGWWISDRTPMSGLVFAFVASAFRIDVPTTDISLLPADENIMTTVDPFGFWAYQLSSAAIATAGALGVVALGTVWFGRRRGAIAGLLFCLMPGIVVYALYPRPALVIVYPALLGLLLAWQRRYILAGLAVGVCYLCHPTGGVWAFAAVTLVWLTTRRPRDTVVATVKMAIPAALLALPWLVFTSRVVGGTSRMIVWPLGAKLTDPTQPLDGVADAWKGLIDVGLWQAAWVRGVSVVRSVVPAEMLSLPEQLGPAWSGLHGLAAWGLVGLVLFPCCILAVVRMPTGLRSIVCWLVVVVVGVNVAIEGFPESFFPQSLLPVLGLLAIALAAWMVTWRRSVQVVVIGLALAELASLIWTPALFVPFGIGPVGLTLAIVVAASCQVIMVVVLIALLRSTSEVRHGPRSHQSGAAVVPRDRASPGRAAMVG